MEVSTQIRPPLFVVGLKEVYVRCGLSLRGEVSNELSVCILLILNEHSTHSSGGRPYLVFNLFGESKISSSRCNGDCNQRSEVGSALGDDNT